MTEMSKEARECRAKYMRERYRQNKEKERLRNIAYWERRAQKEKEERSD